MFKRHIQVNGIKKGEAYIIHIMNNLNMEQKNMINRNMEQQNNPTPPPQETVELHFMYYKSPGRQRSLILDSDW